MVQCPDCGKNNEADFGMTTCQHCGAVFMVGIDGQIDTSEATIVAEEPSQELVSEEEPPTFEEEPTEYLAQEDAPQDIVDEEVPTEEEPAQEEEYSEDFLQNLSGEETLVESIDETKDPLGIQKFDQSVESELREGPYYYDVLLQGLDTQQIKKQVLEALADPRFGLPVEVLRKKVHMGELRLDALNPVKAMLIVLKLQDYDIDIQWTQKLFTAPDSQDPVEVEDV